MATRSIGIDYDGTTLRCVLLHGEGEARLLAHAGVPWDGRAPLGPLLQEALGWQPASGDCLAAAVPVGIGLTRTLDFPFSERAKLAAALPLALSVQLPLPLEELAIAAQHPRPAPQGGASVAAAAIPLTVLQQIVAPFDVAGLPLHCLDLLPSALAAGLAGAGDDGNLLCLHGGWGIFLQLRNGGLAEHRLLALPATLTPAARAALLERELRTLAAGRPAILRLCGAEAEALLPHLTGATLFASGYPLPSAFVPALALARRGQAPQRGDSYNFRGDPLAAPAQLAAAHRRLLTVAAVAGAAALVLLLSLGLRWWDQHRQAAMLQAELRNVFQQAMPDGTPLIDVNRQLAAELANLQGLSRPGGQVPQLAPLALLCDLSRHTPPEVGLSLRSLAIDNRTVQLEGSVASLQGVDRLLAALRGSPTLGQARLLDSQSNASATAVAFRLQIPLPGEEVRP